MIIPVDIVFADGQIDVLEIIIGIIASILVRLVWR